MEKITDYQVAEYLGISGAMFSLVMQGKKHFGNRTARAVKDKTGLPFSFLVEKNGKELYDILRPVCVARIKNKGRYPKLNDTE